MSRQESRDRKSNFLKLRKLDSYKSMHIKTAEEKNLKEQFLAAPTLTAARRILFGKK